MFLKDTLLCKIDIRYACTIMKWIGLSGKLIRKRFKFNK